MRAANFNTRLAAARVDLRQVQITQANHNTYQVENIVNDLWLDYANPVGRECLIEDRERIQRAADKLTELLAKIGTKQMEAAE
jgi:hypothetical protein